MPLLSEIHARWHAIFTALECGNDVPPGQRLRTEGLMEAAVLMDVASQSQLQRDMNAAYFEVFGESLAAVIGDDWAAFCPFPQIPAMGLRAPVYPSTTD